MAVLTILKKVASTAAVIQKHDDLSNLMHRDRRVSLFPPHSTQTKTIQTTNQCHYFSVVDIICLFLWDYFLLLILYYFLQSRSINVRTKLDPRILITSVYWWKSSKVSCICTFTLFWFDLWEYWMYLRRVWFLWLNMKKIVQVTWFCLNKVLIMKFICVRSPLYCAGDMISFNHATSGLTEHELHKYIEV